jgi:hypothetical protein
MLTDEFINPFADEWIASWNSHDLDRILHHYTNDFEIETPIAAKLVPGSNGRVSGKPQVRQYWTLGLQMIPNLHFQLIDVLSGINSITIYYVNTATKRRSAETMFLNSSGKVYKAVVTYAG